MEFDQRVRSHPTTLISVIFLKHQEYNRSSWDRFPKDDGIWPESWLLYNHLNIRHFFKDIKNYKEISSFKFPNDDGMGPESLLLCKCLHIRFFLKHQELQMAQLIQISQRRWYLTRESVVTQPPKYQTFFWNIKNYNRFSWVRFPKDDGICPVSWLSFNHLNIRQLHKTSKITIDAAYSDFPKTMEFD